MLTNHIILAKIENKKTIQNKRVMNKYLISVITLASLVSLFSGNSVKAQQELCIRNNRGQIHCGVPVNNSNNIYDSRETIQRNINKIYQEILERDADYNGLRTYTNNVMNRNWSLNQVRKEVIDSRETQDKINQIYRDFLGRNVDSNGLNHYRGKLEGGWSMSQVRRDVASSDEARRRR